VRVGSRWVDGAHTERRATIDSSLRDRLAAHFRRPCRTGLKGPRTSACSSCSRNDSAKTLSAAVLRRLAPPIRPCSRRSKATPKCDFRRTRVPPSRRPSGCRDAWNGWHPCGEGPPWTPGDVRHANRGADRMGTGRRPAQNSRGRFRRARDQAAGPGSFAGVAGTIRGRSRLHRPSERS
jgi:hypothetical protein